MKQQIYAVTLFGGYMHLVKSTGLDQAKAVASIDSGAASIQHVALATPEDIEWVRTMGGPVPKLDPVWPSEWAKEGYYVVEGNRPHAGQECDYYDRDGCKRQGTVKSFDGETIIIAGIRVVTVDETFKVRYGR